MHCLVGQRERYIEHQPGWIIYCSSRVSAKEVRCPIVKLVEGLPAWNRFDLIQYESLYHALSSLQQIYTMQKKNWVFCFQDYAPFFSKDMCSIPHHVVWCIISQDGSIGSQFSLFIWYRWNLPITQHAWLVPHCCQVALSPSCFKESESWYSMLCLPCWICIRACYSHL